MQKPDKLYHEEIDNFWGITGFVTILVVILVSAIEAFQPAGIDWFFVVIFGLALVSGFILLNFLRLTIAVSYGGIRVAFGLIHYYVTWDNISGCEIHPTLPLLSFGAYGIGITGKRHQSMLSYVVTGEKVFILRLKAGRFGYFAFSTRHPDKLAALVNGKMGLAWTCSTTSTKKTS